MKPVYTNLFFVAALLSCMVASLASAQSVDPAPDLRPPGSIGTPINIRLPDDWAPATGGTPVDLSEPIQGVPVDPPDEDEEAPSDDE